MLHNIKLSQSDILYLPVLQVYYWAAAGDTLRLEQVLSWTNLTQLKMYDHRVTNARSGAADKITCTLLRIELVELSEQNSIQRTQDRMVLTYMQQDAWQAPRWLSQ